MITHLSYPKVIILILLSLLLVTNGQFAAEKVTLQELGEINSVGEPVLLGKTVTVEGTVVVNTGEWHDSANYFAIIDSNDPPYGVLVYLPGTTTPQVLAGDRIKVTGEVSTRGYSTDDGTTVIISQSPNDITILNHGLLVIKGYPIPTDVTGEIAQRHEGSLVQVEGRLSQHDNNGITRGFWVDGSRDGNIEDSQGKIYIKFYNYAGIDISHLHNGSYVIVTGVLLRSDGRHGEYYIRPTYQGSIVEDPARTRPPGPEEKPPGLTYKLEPPKRIKTYGLFELAGFKTSLPLLREMYPDWKPDGSGILLTLGKEKGARITQETAETNLFLLQFTGGSEPQQLTYESYPHAFPCWSPDGKRIAYAAAPNIDDLQGNWDIFIWDFEDKPVQVTDSPSYETALSWSPEGDSLIYTSNINGNWDLWWHPLKGTAVQLTTDLADEGYPDWSQKGLLFQKRGNDGRFDIWRAQIEFVDSIPRLIKQTCLTLDLNGNNVYPRWSPKADKIAFMSSACGSWDLWLVDSDGENKHRLTNLPGNELYPAWDPRERWLAFVRGDEEPGLWVLDVEQAIEMEIPFEHPSSVNVQPPELAWSLEKAPIQKITWPLLTQPVFVAPGENFAIKLRGINSKKLTVRLTSPNSQWEISDVKFADELNIEIPVDFEAGMYDLTILTDRIIDFQPRSVIVIDPKSDFCFAIITDVHLNNQFVGEGNEYLMRIIKHVNEVKPDFAVFTGDLVENTDTYGNDYSQLYNILLEYARFPIFVAMGNHDGQVSGDTNGFNYWQAFMGHLYYSFKFGNWKFLVLNTYDHPQFPTADGVIGEEQLKCLEGQLQIAQDKGEPTAVFLHHNPFDTRWVFFDEGRNRLRDLLEVYGVSHVFAGHRHTDQLDESVTTIIVTTRTAQAATEDRVGYRLVTVKGSYITNLHKHMPKESWRIIDSP